MLIESVMSRSVITADKETPLIEICKLMQRNHIGCVVISKDKIPIGIVTERDIVTAVAASGHFTSPALTTMKSPVFYLHPKEDTKKAIEFMRMKNIRRLPIVEKRQLVGIITYGDILRIIEKQLAESTLETKQLRVQISKDGLTHFYTQKYFKNLLEKEIERVKRYGGYLSLLMIDIDHFKKINDTYGHDAGDYVLSRVAFLIQKNTRKINIIARYGGDEFSIIAPISDIEGAIRLGKRLREFVGKTNFHYGNTKIKITLSIGVTSWDKSIQDARGLIIKADRALYKSKHSGRNMVSII